MVTAVTTFVADILGVVAAVDTAVAGVVAVVVAADLCLIDKLKC